jgi:hypothetical protein
MTGEAAVVPAEAEQACEQASDLGIPVAVHREVESYDVTLRHLDRAGADMDAQALTGAASEQGRIHRPGPAPVSRPSATPRDPSDVRDHRRGAGRRPGH